MNKQFIAILGAGESGVGAALLAKAKGFEVFVSDRGKIKPKYEQELIENEIPFEQGQHDEQQILQAQEVIKSPGIPDTVLLIKKIKEKGIPVIGEIEFASRYTQAKIVGITGSNGKTTTTLLTYHILKECGLEVGMGGNVGTSFSRSILEDNWPLYVLELSSFQLDNIEEFRSDISMILNISPDHLDRYEYQMQKYIEAKFRIQKNQTNKDWFYYNEEDENITNRLQKIKTKPQLRAINSKYFIDGHLKVGGLNFDLRETGLKGRHNAMNALFAIEAALQLGCQKAPIQEALKTFKNDPHRMEEVRTLAGVSYINDSKATNVDATFYALDAMDQPTIWIVGGQDKGNDYTPLLPLVKAKVTSIICLGVDNKKLIESFGHLVSEIVETNSAEDAVKEATKVAQNGEVVLLSPACASFDLFRNYLDRGDQFREAVNKL